MGRAAARSGGRGPAYTGFVRRMMRATCPENVRMAGDSPALAAFRNSLCLACRGWPAHAKPFEWRMASCGVHLAHRGADCPFFVLCDSIGDALADGSIPCKLRVLQIPCRNHLCDRDITDSLKRLVGWRNGRSFAMGDIRAIALTESRSRLRQEKEWSDDPGGPL